MFEWIFQLFTVKIFPPPTLFDYLYSWVLFGGIVAAIFIISTIVIFGVKKIFIKKRLSLHLLNGIKVMVRLFLIIFIFILFTAASPSMIPGGLPPEIAILISAITGAIIAFSTTSILENFIAGLYILFTRPYRIGDLIQIGDQEGIVEEVSLNYTKIRRPSGAEHMVSNSSIIKSETINFTISAEMLKKENDFKLKEIFLKKDITRYWFTLDLPKKNPSRTTQILDKICDKYEKLLKYRPEYYVSDILAQITIDFVLLTNNPQLIFQNKSAFIKDIYAAIFAK